MIMEETLVVELPMGVVRRFLATGEITLVGPILRGQMKIYGDQKKQDEVDRNGGDRVKIELPDGLVSGVVDELRRIREEVGRLDTGHDNGNYARVISVVEARRQASDRASGLGAQLGREHLQGPRQDLDRVRDLTPVEIADGVACAGARCSPARRCEAARGQRAVRADQAQAGVLKKVGRGRYAVADEDE